jgi:hypothetical protein
MTRHDTIVEELHRVRERIGRAHGFDVDRIAAEIRAHEAARGSRDTRRAPKRRVERVRAFAGSAKSAPSARQVGK